MGSALISAVTQTAWQSFHVPNAIYFMDVLRSEQLVAESSRVKCMSHHSTAAVTESNYLPIFLEGGKAQYFHFSKEDETGK